MKEYSNGRPYQMDTGFSVTHGVAAYVWNANISGPNSYTYSYHSDGGNGFDKTWHGQHHISNGDNGRYSGNVHGNQSYALLDDGDLCFSGGPYTLDYL